MLEERNRLIPLSVQVMERPGLCTPMMYHTMFCIVIADENTWLEDNPGGMDRVQAWWIRSQYMILRDPAKKVPPLVVRPLRPSEVRGPAFTPASLLVVGILVQEFFLLLPLYQMITQFFFVLRACGVNRSFWTTAFDVNKCLERIKCPISQYRCASLIEQSSTTYYLLGSIV